MPAIEQVPIACTLGPAEMGPRLQRIQRLTQTHLVAHELVGPTLRLQYDPAAAEELATIVSLERECCAFLTFDMAVRPDAVELVISAPGQVSSDAKWLFSQFLPTATPSEGCMSCACGEG